MRVYRDIAVTVGGRVVNKTISVFDLMEATYSGQDMGKRVITATIKWPTPIDFQIGDYVELSMQSLLRTSNHGTIATERFYIYTEPQCKKTARRMAAGDAFEITVNFYPRQYELIGIQMRDFIQQSANVDSIIYTGFDNVSFYGGAHELMRRIKGCLDQQYTGANEWNYVIADSIDEEKNNALERYSFTFSGNSVMDALMKLNDKDGINTTFYINGRTIYVGFKRPYLCCVDKANNIVDNPLRLMYGKTSHLDIDKDYGGLYDIAKSVGEEVPITKLFAYGASRNLNRYYCADRIQSGRFVNKLMLPSFSDDGQTDWIISDQAAKKYGIHEGSKTFDEIYPSLRYMTYADIRGIKYCIKIKTSGIDADQWVDGKMDHKNSHSTYPVARVQCYKVTPCTGVGTDGTLGVNKLVECAPPEDLAIFVHAYGKTVKCILCGGADNAEALAKQKVMDGEWSDKAGYYRIPAHTRKGDDYIPGSCYCVHNWPDSTGTLPTPADRTSWFENDATAINDRESNVHRIEYVDTFWLTDLYVFEDYDQTHFKRDGYSAWAWPRFNDDSGYAGTLPVNEVVAVEPVVIPDTSDNLSGGRQQHFDIYLRDLGFALDEQNDFGEMVFVFDTPVVSVLDGLLAGREFTIDGGDNLNNYTDRVVCAYSEDGMPNADFLIPGDSGNEGLPAQALVKGAMWRIRMNRNDQDEQLSNVGIVLPNTDIQMEAGDHIVLLDIYMPDIYVRAAEQRLLREAKAFLDKNDRGNVKYSINFDKVRFNQIPNYALQMREGVMLRVVDEDLNITSDNVQRMLVDYYTPAASQVPLFDFEDNSSLAMKNNTYKYISTVNPFMDVILDYNSSTEKMTIKVPRLEESFSAEISIMHSYSESPYTPSLPQTYTRSDDGKWWQFVFNCDDTLYRYLTCSFNVFVEVKESIVTTKSEMVFTPDKIMPAVNSEMVLFKADKYYEVVMEVDDDRFDSDPSHMDIMLLASVGNVNTRYVPADYIVDLAPSAVGGFRRITYKFHLPTSFNDSHGYYIALWYTQDGVTEYSEIRLKSVLEKDLDETGSIVNYVDFKIASVNIKINDNTRPEKPSSESYSAEENKRGRIMQGDYEPIREITAQIDEQTKASTWGTLMNNVEEQRIEQEQNIKTFETLAQAARRNYQNLLALRENIFDPDGTCKDTFLQVMMLQVGADSMNYQLEKTLTTADGMEHNYSVDRPAGASYDKFEVYEDDMLHHFVYTQGSVNQGTWIIPGNFSANLVSVTSGGTTSWPTYYVCIRCKKSSDNILSEPAWICSTKQYAVNDTEDTSYWYFNWGILIADSSGNYTLQETRGNAYMYGDNIVCGKISDIAKNSYFDLTHGDFVLGKGGTPALEYINGVLTIHGLTDTEIGGENLYGGQDPFVLSGRKYTGIILENGKKYVIKIGDITGNAYDIYAIEKTGTSTYNDLGKIADGTGGASTVTYKDKKIVVTGTGKELGFRCGANSGQSWKFTKIMVQRGDKDTAYQEYVKHLTDAIKGTTEISGGLVMTNLLLLKDENNAVNAGMSGISDDNASGSFGDGTHSEGVALFAGGSYEDALKQAKGLYSQLQQLLPVLLTKTGIHSKIGPFEVISDTAVAVKNSDGRKIVIDSNTGISMLDENDKVKFELLMDDIDLNGIATYRGKFNVPDPNRSVTSLNATDYPTGVSLNVADLIGLLPQQGNYRIDFANFYLTVTIGGVILRDDIDIDYVVYLEHTDTSQKFYIVGDPTNKEQVTIPKAFNGMARYATLIMGTAMSSVSINSMPAGKYALGVEIWTQFDFAEAGYFGPDGHHSYRFQVGNSPELVALDGADYSGKVSIGTNGLVVAAGNSTMFTALTNKSGDKMDIRILGIPQNGDQTPLVPGQLFRMSDGVIKSYS